MTIRSRNRANIIFITISIIILLTETALVGYKILVQNYIFPSIYFEKPDPSNILTRYNDYTVFFSLVFLQLYVIVTSIFLWRGFEKTQSSEIAYLLTFLAAIMFDSARLLIPFFYSQGPYSKFIFTLGKSVILARIMAPIALLAANIFNTQEERQNVERNIILIIVSSLLFSVYIPLNTAIVLPNFSFKFSFAKTLLYTSVIISFLTVLTLFYRQMVSGGKQIITIGYTMLSFGYLSLFDCTNLLHFILGIGLLTTGSIMYLSAMHKSYMWDM